MGYDEFVVPDDDDTSGGTGSAVVQPRPVLGPLLWREIRWVMLPWLHWLHRSRYMCPGAEG